MTKDVPVDEAAFHIRVDYAANAGVLGNPAVAANPTDAPHDLRASRSGRR